jgi:hypothetical protein
MGFAHCLSNEGGGERGISPDEVGNIDDLKIRSFFFFKKKIINLLCGA